MYAQLPVDYSQANYLSLEDRLKLELRSIGLLSDAEVGAWRSSPTHNSAHHRVCRFCLSSAHRPHAQYDAGRSSHARGRRTVRRDSIPAPQTQATAGPKQSTKVRSLSRRCDHLGLAWWGVPFSRPLLFCPRAQEPSLPKGAGQDEGANEEGAAGHHRQGYREAIPTIPGTHRTRTVPAHNTRTRHTRHSRHSRFGFGMQQKTKKKQGKGKK